MRVCTWPTKNVALIIVTHLSLDSMRQNHAGIVVQGDKSKLQAFCRTRGKHCGSGRAHAEMCCYFPVGVQLSPKCEKLLTRVPLYLVHDLLYSECLAYPNEREWSAIRFETVPSSHLVYFLNELFKSARVSG